MDYVKLARTALDQFLDRLEEEANKLLEEDKEPKKPSSKKPDDFGWYHMFVRLEEVEDSMYGQRYQLLTDRNHIVDRSFSKARLLERWGLQED